MSYNVCRRKIMSYIIALDEGTTSTRAVLFNIKKQKIERVKNVPIKQYYPKPGYVKKAQRKFTLPPYPFWWIA